MKYCPTCETRYDEEILRFCMKDGTPLIEEEEPNFVAMPSESLEEPPEDDDAGEVTVIRRNSPAAAAPPPPPDPDEDKYTSRHDPKQRIVVPTFEEPRGPQPPRTAQYQAPPPRSNTALVVILTVLGTVAVLGIGALGFWLLQNGGSENTNQNTNANQNVNTEVNTNLGLDTNFNFNANSNFNSNIDINANANRTPTPTPTATPTPKPSPSVTPSPSPTRTPADDDDDDDAGTPQPSPTRPPPTPTPRAPATPDRPVNGGVLNGRAISLPVPAFPTAARAVGASGRVEVQVVVDERGNVVSARAVTGHPLLRPAAENAARRSRIAPERAGNRPVRTTGLLLYNFRSN